eukprot:TRINITY_DN1621_c0_g1_i2.p1 TRINITY_DN1621_c0_g1~~TRINITY_DN1621_c0_g1_i2.p1  ORF type:complete len:206 (-),score=47.95 TRINITY_DN1621_c0_g1_i2:674-1231(-)
MGSGGSKNMPQGVECWGVLHHSTGKIFGVLTKTHFLAFKNKNEYMKHSDHPMDYAICSLPLYDLVATADAEGLDSQTIFLLRTSERLIKVRTSKADEQLQWLTAISKVAKNADLIAQRRENWKKQGKWTLHCYVVEATDIEDTSGTYVSAHIEKVEKMTKVELMTSKKFNNSQELPTQRIQCLET